VKSDNNIECVNNPLKCAFNGKKAHHIFKQDWETVVTFNGCFSLASISSMGIFMTNRINTF
jgi:hypothetical protein